MGRQTAESLDEVKEKVNETVGQIIAKAVPGWISNGRIVRLTSLMVN